MIKEADAGIDGVEKMLLPIEERNAKDVEKQISDAKTAFAARKEKKTKELDETIERTKAEIATSKGEKRDVASVLHQEAKQAKKDTLVKLELEHQAEIDDILFRSKVFVLYINGHPFVTTEDINKKIVKGLGEQLFVSHYRFEVPHDAYRMVDDGIALTVDEMVDYGKERYVKCHMYDEVIYVKADKAYQPNDTIRVSMDLENIRIFENKFDIRLY